MANVNGGLVSQKTQGNQQTQQQPIGVKNILANINMKKRFEEMLGKRAAGFMTSVINISNSPGLQGCDPNSIVSSAIVAATLDLPIDQNLGFAYIVPYDSKKTGKVAQFQMGYKGFIQLAMRSGQYKTISAAEVYEGEIKKHNRITGDVEINEDFEPKEDSKIVGYIAYFKLLNGFEKYLYMTVVELQAHGKKFSQSYKSEKQWVREGSLWAKDFHSMATKTVLKLLLSKYGMLSIEMQKALETDQAVIKDDVAKGAEINGEVIDYPDNHSDAQDTEYTEVKEDDQYKGTPFEQ